MKKKKKKIFEGMLKLRLQSLSLTVMARQTCVTLRLTTVYTSLRRQLSVIDDYTVCGPAPAGHTQGHLLSD